MRITGLFDFIFGNRPKEPKAAPVQYKMLTGYEPTFHRYGGNIYEAEMVRAAIAAIASHVSKLNVEIIGTAKPALQTKMRLAPNELQTWSQFLSRLVTILYVHNNAFVVPVYDEYGAVSGVYAVLPSRCEVVKYGEANVPYLRYTFSWGQKAAVELVNCAILTRHQYRSDLFGETNDALRPVMDLMTMQNQGIEEGVKSAATYRFMAQLSNFAKAEDLAKERQRFTAENFSKDAKGGGLLLFPNTYQNIQQIEAKPWVIDDKQMTIIREGVLEYFGISEKILKNEAYGDEYAAFYEGVVEPFAVQFSEVMTRMLFTYRERAQGSRIMATASQIQFMTNADKLNVSAQMADRGLMTRNEIREIWNLPPLPEPLGSQLPIRGEYYNANEVTQEGGGEE